MAEDQQGRVAEQIGVWRDELIDLSRRNRLLNAIAGRSAVLRVEQPSIHRILADLNVLDSERGRGYWRFHYPPSADLEGADPVALAALHAEDPEITDELDEDELLTDVSSALVLSRRLRALERQAATEYMDKGTRNLYLGLGVLRWCEAADEWMESPIVMLPVSLARPSPREPFRLRALDDDPVVNPALRVKMESDFSIELPELEAIDDAEPLISVVKERVSGQVGWTVASEALFGRFSFQKEAMYRDLRANLAEIVGSPLIRAISGDESVGEVLGFETIPDRELDDMAPPEECSSILDADSTQRRCIVAARDGHSFVMDGPPGTGKSQTIANVIAELLAANKTVLFVSEKIAALDVVKSRLDRASLGTYVLELHSNKATRKEVAQELGRVLGERPRPLRALDPTEIDRVRSHRNALTAFAAAQNELREPFGRTLHWAIGRYLQLSEAPQAPPPRRVGNDLARTEFDGVLELARRLSAAWTPVEKREEFLWRELADPQAIGNLRSQIPAILEQAELVLTQCRDQFEASADSFGVAIPRSRNEYLRHRELVELLSSRPDVPPQWLQASDSDVAARAARIDEWTTRARRHGDAMASLATNGAARVTPDIARHFVVTKGELDGVELPFDVGEATTATLADLVASLEWVGSAGPMVLSGAAELQAALGLSSDTAIGAIRAAVELGRLGAAPYRPESHWFAPEQLDAARRAVDRLEPIVSRYRALTDQLRGIFNEGIFRFDVERLYDSPGDVIPNVSRTSGRGRANRKQLKACARTGKVSSDVVATLPSVREWRELGSRLQIEEGASAPILGTSHYRSVNTDFSALREALSVAEKALALVGPAISDSPVGERLGAASLDAPRIAEQAKGVGERVDEWDRKVATIRSGASSDGSPTDIVAWAAEVLSQVRAFHSAMGTVCASLPEETTVTEAASLCDAVLLVHEIDNALIAEEEVLREGFGALYRRLETDWSSAAEASDWAAAVIKHLGGSVSEDVARRLLREEIRFEEIESAWLPVEKACDEIIGWFAGQQRAAIETELGGRIEDAVMFLGDLRRAAGQIDEWLAFEETARSLAEAGYSGVTDYCIERKTDRSLVPDVFERAMLTAWIDGVLASDARCRPFKAEDRDRLVEEFQRLDQMLVDTAATRVMEVANRRRPTSVAGAFSIIRHEAEKKKKHRPIRRLLEEAGTATLALKPCFMMSPLSVSQFVPPTMKFDAVIFDEASQVRPCDAVGAIYRGTQLIVAGDNKQLPPTNFFERGSDDGSDQYDEEAFEEFDSVLDLCRGAGALQDLPLRWHYRSRHESLITYSNRAFYDSTLVTYPGATQVATDVGLEFVHVPDGIYGRGTSQDNVIEARKVVERVLFHADHHPQVTLGVVAFSEAQATRIQWELEAARRERPDLDAFFHEGRLDGFFVKNLESVQGDERDIVIFSIGYGRDENGKLTMSFGPLNKTGGQRRLNVAITRARSRVEVVSSIRSVDMSESTNAGVYHLRGYLDFAERGAPALAAITVDAGEPESPFEVEVLSTLRKWGYEVEPQVGQAGYRIDMAIRHPEHRGQWLLGVECDGAAYHSSATARDRDRLRQQVLEGLGWRLHRIWGPSWYRDRATSEERLRGAIQRALVGEQPSQGLVERVAPVVMETVELDDSVIPEWVVPYHVAWLDDLAEPPELGAPSATSVMKKWVLEVVRREGPVHPDVVLKRVRDYWRAGGVRSRFRQLVESASLALLDRGDLRADPDGFFVTGEGSTEVVVRAPTRADDRSSRSIREVPPSEIRRAIVLLVRDVHEIHRDEIVVRIARIFGWRRTGPEISEKIESCLAELVRDRTLHALAGTIRPVTAP